MNMTLQQIAINNGLSYWMVYNAARHDGILVKRTKNYEYDEKSVLMAVDSYLSNKIWEHKGKIADLSAERKKIMKKIGNT